MKKYIYLTFYNLAITLLMACVKDRGNYKYSAAEIITAKGLAATYTVITQKDNLTIPIEVSDNIPNADLAYEWSIYPAPEIGQDPALLGKLTIISKEKDLNYPIKETPRTWNLLLKITNKNNGFSQYFTATLHVVSEYSDGWYVAKDNGSQSDIDFFTPTHKFENLYSAINGQKINGAAKQLNFFSGMKDKKTNIRTIMLVTSKDMVAIDVSTFKFFKNFNSFFFETPKVVNPNSVFLGDSFYNFINDNKLHTLNTLVYNDSKFGIPVMIDENNSPYTLSPYFAPSITPAVGSPIFFDNLSSSFLEHTSFGVFRQFKDDVEKPSLSCKNNNQTLLYMASKYSVNSNSYIRSALGIMKDKTNPNYKGIFKIDVSPSESQNGLNKAHIEYELINPSSNLFKATTYTVNLDESILYFVVGNQLWSRNLNNGNEILQFTAPAGESITFIRQINQSFFNEDVFHHVIIATKIGGNYKIRIFNKSSGNLESTPKTILEGIGIAKDIFNLSTRYNDNTMYPMSYL